MDTFLTLLVDGWEPSRMDARLKLVGLTGRMAFVVAAEKLSNPRPSTLAEVPSSPEHLTTQWLTLALCDGIPGAAVDSFELGPRNDGTSARRQLRVAYNDDGRAAALPEYLFTKSSPGLTTRLLSSAASLGRIESTFYAQVRPWLDIEAPKTMYSAFDAVTNRQLLILDDVTVTRGAQFGTILTRTLTRQQAEQVVDTLARLHAAFWGQPLAKKFGSWAPTAHDWIAQLNTTLNAPQRVLSGFDRGRDVIPAALHARRSEFHPAMMRAMELNVTNGPQTLLHGDVHPGNWYVARDGAMGLYDWQCIVRGGWARDLAYALSSHLSIEDRRAWETDLLARHRERLAEAGVDAPDPATAFLAYRQAMTHAAWMWLGTIGRHRLQPNMQPLDICLETLQRTCTACDDLDTLDAIWQ